jgi:ketosteroid isomerase-like protein
MTDLTSLFETYKNAVFQKDIAAFTSIYDENVLVFDMWGQWTYEGLPAWTAMAKDWFASLGTNRDAVDFGDIQVQASGELATATATVKFTAISDTGKELRFLQNRLTWIVQKKGNGWKIIHQHTSTPIDVETMKAILHK